MPTRSTTNQPAEGGYCERCASLECGDLSPLLSHLALSQKSVPCPESRVWCGFAAGCEARLCLAYTLKQELGYALVWTHFDAKLFFFSAAARFCNDLAQRSNVGCSGLNNRARKLCFFSFHVFNCFSVYIRTAGSS